MAGTKKVFCVTAERVELMRVTVEAETKEEAIKIAEELPGSDFRELSDAEWRNYEAEEVD